MLDKILFLPGKIFKDTDRQEMIITQLKSTGIDANIS
jgi:hypothetical protein